MWVNKDKVAALQTKIDFLEKENEVRLAQVLELEKRLEDSLVSMADKFNKLYKQILTLQENSAIDDRKTNLKIDEYDRQLREDMERGFTGIMRTFDKRLEQMGEKRGIVMDLLKKIASLENNNVGG